MLKKTFTLFGLLAALVTGCTYTAANPDEILPEQDNQQQTNQQQTVEQQLAEEIASEVIEFCSGPIDQVVNLVHESALEYNNKTHPCGEEGSFKAKLENGKYVSAIAKKPTTPNSDECQEYAQLRKEVEEDNRHRNFSRFPFNRYERSLLIERKQKKELWVTIVPNTYKPQEFLLLNVKKGFRPRICQSIGPISSRCNEQQTKAAMGFVRGLCTGFYLNHKFQIKE